MIPSTPRRTWLFLLASSLAFFGPDLLAPAAWLHSVAYERLSALYQAGIVGLGFWYGPAICRALVVAEVVGGSLRAALDRAVAGLQGQGLPLPPVTLAEYPASFVVTVGLLPKQSEVFLSSGLVQRLSDPGLRFLLARAAVHASLRQRLAALLPVLAFTLLLPDAPHSLAAWLILAGALAAWLGLHWLFELDADRRTGRVLGREAVSGLLEVQGATASRLGWLSPQPPTPWRLRAVAGAEPAARR